LKIFGFLFDSLPLHIPYESFRNSDVVVEEDKVTAMTFHSIIKSSRAFSLEATELLFKNAEVHFKFVPTNRQTTPKEIYRTRDYELRGFGCYWYAYNSFSNAVSDLKNLRAIHLILPELQMTECIETRRRHATPYLNNSVFGINFKHDIAQIVRIFNALPLLSKFTVIVPMSQAYLDGIRSEHPHALAYFQHFKHFLRPLKSFKKCGIEIKVIHTTDPSFVLKDRCRKAWSHVDLIERGGVLELED
jgi:hypothetical protein